MSWGHITCQKGGHASCPLRNKCGGGLRALMSCFARCPKSRTISHETALNLRPSGSGGASDRAWTRVNTGPMPRLRHFLSRDLVMGGPEPLDGVRTLSNGSELLYFGGPGCAHRGPALSGPDGVASENATLTAHEIPLGLFSVRLRVAAQASCLYSVVRGTPNPGYR